MGPSTAAATTIPAAAGVRMRGAGREPQSWVFVMLRAGNSIRLTRKEAERLELITGFSVEDVRTLADLEQYVADCKAYYFEESREYMILARLIDSEASRCLAAA